MQSFSLRSRVQTSASVLLLLGLSVGCSAAPASLGSADVPNLPELPALPALAELPALAVQVGDGTSAAALRRTRKPCANKACGVDCSPKGTDEPFNCNAAGACVAAGEPLECPAPDPCAGKACGVDCSPMGTDEPFNCNAAGACVAAGEPLECSCTQRETTFARRLRYTP